MRQYVSKSILSLLVFSIFAGTNINCMKVSAWKRKRGIGFDKKGNHIRIKAKKRSRKKSSSSGSFKCSVLGNKLMLVLFVVGLSAAMTENRAMTGKNRKIIWWIIIYIIIPSRDFIIFLKKEYITVTITR